MFVYFGFGVYLDAPFCHFLQLILVNQYPLIHSHLEYTHGVKHMSISVLKSNILKKYLSERCFLCRVEQSLSNFYLDIIQFD